MIKKIKTAKLMFFSIFLFLLILSIVTPTISEARENKATISLYVKGRLVEDNIGSRDTTNSSRCFIKNGRTFLPLRKVSELLDYEVKYEPRDKKVLINGKDKNIIMKIGDTTIITNQGTIEMDVVPFLDQSTTYVPVRFLLEALGESVQWDSDNNVVLLSSYPLKGSHAKNLTTENISGLAIKFEKTTDFDKKIDVEVSGDRISFYDKYNRENSKDSSSGHIGSVILSKSPQTLIVPGIVLDYNSHGYIELIWESGVEYSLKDESFKKNYELSKKFLEESFLSFTSE